MTPEKVKQVLADFKAILGEARRIPDADYKFASKVWTKDARGHAAWMCDEAIKLVDAGEMEKAMRWLGWVNATLWITGLRSLDEIGGALKPDTTCELSPRDQYAAAVSVRNTLYYVQAVLDSSLSHKHHAFPANSALVADLKELSGELVECTAKVRAIIKASSHYTHTPPHVTEPQPSIEDCAITEVEVTKPIRDTEVASHNDFQIPEGVRIMQLDVSNPSANALADSASPVPWSVMGVDPAVDNGSVFVLGGARANRDAVTEVEVTLDKPLNVTRAALDLETHPIYGSTDALYNGPRGIKHDDDVVTSATDEAMKIGIRIHEQMFAYHATEDAKKTMDMVDEAIIKLSEPPPVKHVLGVYTGEPNTVVHSLDELEVERTWVLSSAHIPETELECLTDSDDVVTQLDSHGCAVAWTVNVDYTDIAALKDDLESLFGESVVNIAMTAQSLGFQRVRFDVDGNKLPVFPVFDA